MRLIAIERPTLSNHQRQILPQPEKRKSFIDPQTATARELITSGISSISRIPGDLGPTVKLPDGKRHLLSLII